MGRYRLPKALAVLLATQVAACSGGGGGGSSPSGTASNNAPTVTATGDLQVNGGETVVLSAYGADADGDAITYEWVQTAGTRVRLDDSQAAMTTFLAPADGASLSFTVRVSDGAKTASANVGVEVASYTGGSVQLTRNPVRNGLAVSTSSVTVEGDVAYVGTGAGGLLLFDATQPTPTQIGSYADTATEFSAGSVKVAGTLAVINGSVLVDGWDRQGVFRVLDVSTPSAPTFLSDIGQSMYNDWALSADASHLYVATYYTGMQIKDLTDPANPVAVTLDTTTNPSLDSFIKTLKLVQTGTKELLYASSGTKLHVFDVTDPANITTLTTIETGAQYDDLAVAGSTLYAAVLAGETTSGVDAFDISNPESPVKTSTWASTIGYVIELAAADNRLYVRGSYTATVLDVSDPAAPVLIGQYLTPGIMSDLELRNNSLFVIDRDWGMFVLDVSQPSFQQEVATFGRIVGGRHIAARNGTAFVTDDDGLHAYNVTDPSAPVKLGSYTGSTYSARELALDGRTAILPDYEGVRFVDITDPAAMSLVGEFDTWSTTFSSIAVKGDYAYAGIEDTYKVWTFDISDKTNPVHVDTDTLDTGYADISQVLVDGDTLHVVSGTGLSSADLTNPADPVFANSSYAVLSGGFDDMVCAADRPVLADTGNGITLADTSDLSQVSETGSYGFRTQGIAISGRYVYVSEWLTTPAQMLVLDIADPANPALAGSLLLPESARDFAVADGHAYAVMDTKGIAVVQSEPTLSSRYTTGLVGGTLTYTVSWDKFPSTVGPKVACRTTGGDLGGQCTVTQLDAVNRTATVSWTLPSTAGDYEIVIAVGDQHSFITTRDRVKAQ